MNYLDPLRWRYATKRMNGRAVPDDKLANILEAVRLAPSSMGLQPYNVMVVKDKAAREKLLPAINQPQVTEGSVLLVFAAWTKINQQQIDDYIQDIASTRGLPLPALDGFKTSIQSIVTAKAGDALFSWTARQAYIGLGYATAAAAFEQVDATPMEGFSPEKLNELLGLEAKGLSAVAIVALGYRNPEADQLAQAPKVRRTAEKFFQHM
ncbi:MAG: nitroreductase family protein [Flavihumibacter sp.]